MGYLVLVASSTLWVVFAVSAVSKLRNRTAYAAFAASTRRLLPAGSPAAARVVATLVAGAEVAVVLALPVLPAVGLALAAILLSAFSVAIGVAVRRGVTAPCRCFGASSRPLGASQAARNAVLALLALSGAALGGSGYRGVTPAGVAIAVFGAVVLALLTIFFDDVTDPFTVGSAPAAGRARSIERI